MIADEAWKNAAQTLLEHAIPVQFRSGYCSTPYCGGWTAELILSMGEVVVSYRCRCGSEDGWDPLPMVLDAAEARREALAMAAVGVSEYSPNTGADAK